MYILLNIFILQNSTGQDRPGPRPVGAERQNAQHAHPAVQDGHSPLWQAHDGLRHVLRRAECRGHPPPQRPDGGWAHHLEAASRRDGVAKAFTHNMFISIYKDMYIYIYIYI